MIAKNKFRNNVTRALDHRGIHHQVYEIPSEKISAVQVAQILGIPPELMYKTIVVLITNSNKPLLVMVPASCDVDLKAVARAINAKKVSLATQVQAESLTGLKAGGISPLALIDRGFRVIIDQSARMLDEIHISGGQLGMILRLSVAALVEMTNANFAHSCR